MAETTKIAWCDATWNPVRGCTKVSEGCKHCYAETFAERWRGIPGHAFEQGFDVRLVPDALEKPIRWKKPRRIFVNSMSDLFHEQVPFDFIDRVMETILECPQHTFQVLTKRPERMLEYMSGLQKGDARAVELGLAQAGEWPPPNLWLGVTLENQAAVEKRLPILLETPAAIRFVSCEPLIGPVHLDGYLSGPYVGLPGDVIHDGYNAGIDWVIVGGESGPKARPMHPQWAMDIRDLCQRAQVPFFFKQWGRYGWEYRQGRKHVAIFNDGTPLVDKDFGQLAGYPKTDRFPCIMCDEGASHSGRLLEGRLWDEFPREERSR